MKQEKSKIFEYYDSVRNSIDIQCEKLHSKFKQNDMETNSINLMRTKFFEKINQVQTHNLNQLDSNKNENQSKENLFKNKFCFCILRKRCDDESSFFGDNKIGKLVITNQYISQSLRDTLSGIYNSEIFDLEFVKLNPQDDILMYVLMELFDVEKEHDILDLSDDKINKIENLKMEKTNIKSLNQTDFDIVYSLIDPTSLKSCYFEAFNLVKIPKNSFKGINHIKELNIVNGTVMGSQYEEGSFNGLNELERLGFFRSDLKVLTPGLLSGLDNLTRLDIGQGKLQAVEKDTFKNLKNLKYLSLFYNKINYLDNKDVFNGLEELKVLELGQNGMTKMNNEIFYSLKNLTYLNLRNNYLSDLKPSCFKELKNLEFLSLIDDRSDNYSIDLEDVKLPKLKYLALNAKDVPNFQGIKLEFLYIEGLEDLDEYSLRGQSKLKGLRLDIDSKMMPKINKKNFECLKNLSYLKIKVKNGLPSKEKFESQAESLKNLLAKKPAFVNNSSNYGGLFEVSNFEEISEEKFISTELNFDQVATEAVNYYYQVNFFY
ncbi:unnamed protein product [Brachionus calyciflorus]|uniref:Uncharacterized protein n=1 Tax=Brachionus calyciflorus TaxID=104777 RepID=A0A813U1I3_9BILA|nr:unnamed protein product [Brachionus calyciflorus]